MRPEFVNTSAADAIRRAIDGVPSDMVIPIALHTLANFYPESNPPGATQWTPGYAVRMQLESIATELQ